MWSFDSRIRSGNMNRVYGNEWKTVVIVVVNVSEKMCIWTVRRGRVLFVTAIISIMLGPGIGSLPAPSWRTPLQRLRGVKKFLTLLISLDPFSLMLLIFGTKYLWKEVRNFSLARTWRIKKLSIRRRIQMINRKRWLNGGIENRYERCKS